MDARTIIGLLIFIVCVALLERSVIDAIWKADEQDGSKVPSTEDSLSKGKVRNWRAAPPYEPLASLKLHRTG